MSTLPLFVNELSFPRSLDDEEGLRRAIEDMLSALKVVASLVDELLLASSVPLSDVLLSSQHQTLSTLSPPLSRDWWRFLKRLEQHVPLAKVPHASEPKPSHAVSIGGLQAIAGHWAFENDSFVLSLPWRDTLRAALLEARIERVDESGLQQEEAVEIRQISCKDNADTWRQQVTDYGFSEAASSAVYQDDLVAFRLYLDDHDPPHVHVFCPDAPRKCRAKFRFDKAEFLKSDLSPSLERHVRDVAARNLEALNAGWSRCRSGSRPFAFPSATAT